MLTKRALLAHAAAVAAMAALPLAASAAPLIVRVPITFSRSGMPIMTLSIGGKGPYKFLIDTGSFASCIREPLAIELGLTRGISIRTGSLSGHEDSYVYKAANIVVGGGFKVPSMSFVGLAHFGFDGIDGVLPASFLTFLPSQLDYEASEIRYYLGGAEMELDGFHKTTSFFQADGEGQAEKVYLDILLEGQKLICCLNTGASSTLLVASGYVESHHLWDKYPAPREGAHKGANGEKLKTRQVVAHNIALGDLHIDAMPIVLSDPSAMETVNDIDGLVGTPFLRNFTIAFQNKQVWFRPNARFAQISTVLPDSMMPEAVQTQTGRSVLPFLYGEQRRILLPAQVTGKPAFVFVLNTGSADSAMRSGQAAELGLVTLPSGDFDAGTIDLSGGVRLPSLHLKPSKGTTAVLGLDFLTALPAMLDFDALQLTLFTADAPDLTGFTKVPAQRKILDKSGKAKFYINARFEGRDLVCRLDTGFPMGIWLPPHTVKAQNLWDKYPDPDNRTAGYGSGQVATRYVTPKGFDIGSFHIDTAPVTMCDPTAADSPFDLACDAVIGMGLIGRFNIAFAGDDTVWFKPNKAFV